jgi:hypothetical protein
MDVERRNEEGDELRKMVEVTKPLTEKVRKRRRKCMCLDTSDVGHTVHFPGTFYREPLDLQTSGLLEWTSWTLGRGCDGMSWPVNLLRTSEGRIR